MYKANKIILIVGFLFMTATFVLMLVAISNVDIDVIHNELATWQYNYHLVYTLENKYVLVAAFTGGIGLFLTLIGILGIKTI